MNLLRVRHSASLAWIACTLIVLLTTDGFLHKPLTSSRPSYLPINPSRTTVGRFAVEQSVENTVAEKDTTLNLLYHVFLRCSPLIGGPIFLPIHMEIILLHQANDDDTNSSSNIPTHLHRLDHLPLTPTDSKTLVQLLSFQHVPSQVRHRIYIVPDLATGTLNDGQNTLMDTALLKNQIQSSSSYSVSWRVVSWKRIQQLLILSDSSHKSVAMNYSSVQGLSFIFPLQSKILLTDQITPKTLLSFLAFGNQTKYTDLHLIWNNCYTFALDLLFNL